MLSGRLSSFAETPLPHPVGLAEALFDNDSEWPDELAFRQGEVLRVLDQKPADGMADGWWLCSDQTGKQGIAPANRLRLFHRFGGFPENKVITPRRFGDVFLYNDSLFPEDEDLFGSSRFNITSGYDMPSGLSRIRLLHDSNHPMEVERSGRAPVVHEVPIRIESRSEDRAGIAKKRKSPPPPPQRRYFHNFSDGSSSEQEKPSDRRTATTSNSISINGGLYDNPKATTVQWRRDVPEKQNYYDTLSVPSTQDRVSGASTVSLTPPEGSERSSSLSESSRSSLQDTYDVPSALTRPPQHVPQRTESNSTTPTPTGHQNGGNSLERSVILNVLEDSLYDSPSSLSQRWKPSMAAERNGNETPLSALPVRSRFADRSGDELLSREPTYDVPKQASVSRIEEQLPSDLERLSVSSIDSKDSDYQELLAGSQELKLSPQKAINRLLAREQELHSALNRLSGFASDKNWRRRWVLQDTISDIRQSVNQVCRCLDAFLDLCRGGLANVNVEARGLRVGEGKKMAKKLAHLLRPLRDSQNILERLRRILGRMGWTLAGLTRDSSSEKAGNDSLDQFIAVGKQIPEDCRQVAAFIQGNASVIFHEEDGEVSTTVSELDSSVGGDRPQQILVNGYPEESKIVEEEELESSASETEQDDNLFDDYDFIDTTKSKEVNGKSEERAGSATPVADLRNGNLVENGLEERNGEFNSEDKQILAFYVPQVDQHMEYLSGAIEGFLNAVEENQPPRLFVGKSKLVILAAHKLVYIGDSVAQCLQSAGPAERTKSASDKLCQVLKECVAATKSAASHFPTVSYIQKMVDSMVSVSHVAHDLKLLLRQMATQEQD